MKLLLFVIIGVLPSLIARDDTPPSTNGKSNNDKNETSSYFNYHSYDEQEQQNAAEKMHESGDILTSIPKLQSLQQNLASASSTTHDNIVVSLEQERTQLLEQGFNYRIRSRSSSIWHNSSNSSSNLTRPAYYYARSKFLDDDVNKEEELANNMATPSPSNDATATGDDNIDSSNNELEQNQKEKKSDVVIDDDDDDDAATKRLLVDYASKSAGALMLESSGSMKGASNLLVGDKDKYAITPCTEKKFVVIGLSEDILVKQIKISNYERYTSLVKEFQVLGSQITTSNNQQLTWVDLGTFTAENRAITEQSFDLKEPTWARYLKFRFMTHYGSEHYCTLSQVKVHGSTMLQGFHEQWNEGDEDDNNNNDDVNIDKEGDDDEKQQEVSQKTKTDHDKDEEEGDIVDEKKQIEKEEEIAAVAEEKEQENTINQNDKADAKDDDVETSAETEGMTTEQEQESVSEKNTNTNDILTENNDPHSTIASDHADVATTMIKEEKWRTAAMPNFDINVSFLKIPKALESPRFLLSGVKSYDAAFTKKYDFLDVIGAINPKDTCRYDFNSPSKYCDELDDNEYGGGDDNNQKNDDYYYYSMQTLSSKIQSTIGRTIDIQQTIQTMIGNALPRLRSYIEETIPQHNQQQMHDKDNADGNNEENNSDIKPTTTKVEEVIDDEKSKRKDSRKVKSEETTDDDISSSSVSSAATTVVDNDRILKNIRLSDGLSEVLTSKYPSSKCLESLNFVEFKKRSIAKVSSASGGGNNPTGGKVLEPIFKTLTDQIKALQISQNVHDQFSNALIACYQSIMTEMANELHDDRVRQEERLSKLESEMMQMKMKKDDDDDDDGIIDDSIIFQSVLLSKLFDLSFYALIALYNSLIWILEEQVSRLNQLQFSSFPSIQNYYKNMIELINNTGIVIPQMIVSGIMIVLMVLWTRQRPRKARSSALSQVESYPSHPMMKVKEATSSYSSHTTVDTVPLTDDDMML